MTPRNANAPAIRGASGAELGGGLHRDSTTGMSVEQFLSHWQGVRRVKPDSWTAKAHPDQRTGSVSITYRDGHWLIHDFAGKDTASLLAERGLTMADLFPTRLKPLTPEERRVAQQYAKESKWKAALELLVFEASIVAIAAGDILVDKALDWADYCRVVTALDRISKAQEVLRGR